MNGPIGNQKIKQLRDALQNSDEAVVVRIGMATRRFSTPIATPLTRKATP